MQIKYSKLTSIDMDIPALFLSIENSFLLSTSLAPLWLTLILVVIQVTDRAAVLLPSLLAVFILCGIVVSWVALPHIAFSVWVFGLFATLILYLSVRKLIPRTTPQINLQERGYRLLIGLALGIVAYLIGSFAAFPTGHAAVSSTIWALLTLGGLRFSTANRSTEMGIGLLLILSGMGVWLTGVNGSAIILGLWAAGTILLALAVGWLTDRTEGAEGEMPIIHDQASIVNRHS